MPSRSVSIWLGLGILLILIMVSIGGLTRLTHSGLSMVHWTFTGSLPPMNEVEWAMEFERYQTSPEFQELHSHFTLSEFKSIFWWEYIHRMFGRMIGLVFIFPFIFFLFTKRIPRQMIPQFVVILLLGTAQALLGWFMVQSGLIDVPRVSHFRLSAHLITAFITCSYILWVTMNYIGFGNLKLASWSGRKWVWTLFGLLIVQIIYGGFVAGLKAGWMHNTWPLMDGYLIAPSVWAMDPLILNFLEGGSGVQFVHRTLAIVVMGLGIWLWKIGRSAPSAVERATNLVLVTIGIQVVLGIATLLLHVPISIAVIHQVVALLTLLSVTYLLHKSSFE